MTGTLFDHLDTIISRHRDDQIAFLLRLVQTRSANPFTPETSDPHEPIERAVVHLIHKPVFTFPTLIRGGMSINAVPDQCVAYGDVRLLPGDDADMAERLIRARRDHRANADDTWLRPLERRLDVFHARHPGDLWVWSQWGRRPRARRICRPGQPDRHHAYFRARDCGLPGNLTE
jgi:acetylornithine deacetylase/succinyl-diaminopimelate desuccinylase-like protein